MSKITLERVIEYVLQCTKIDNFEEEGDGSEGEHIIAEAEQREMEKINNTLAPSETAPIKYAPKNLEKIFNISDKNITRLGVIKETGGHNISFYSSVVTCIKDDFLNLTIDNQNIYVKRFLEKLKKDVVTLDVDLPKKEKKDMAMDIEKIKTSHNLINITAHYLNINIIIIDYDKDKLSVAYMDREFNKYKMLVVLLLTNGVNYEPLLYKGGRQWTCKNDMIANLLENNTNVEGVNKLGDDKFVMLNGAENLEKYIKVNVVAEEQKVSDESKTSSVSDNDNNFAEGNTKKVLPLDADLTIEDNEDVSPQTAQDSGIFYKQKTAPVNDAMKMAELKTIAKGMGIKLVLDKKPKTKTQLISEINKK